MSIHFHLDKIVVALETLCDITADREEIITAASMVVLGEIHVRDLSNALQVRIEELEKAIDSALCFVPSNYPPELEEAARILRIALKEKP